MRPRLIAALAALALVTCASSCSNAAQRPEAEPTEPNPLGPEPNPIEPDPSEPTAHPPPPPPPGAPAPYDCRADADCAVAAPSGPDPSHPCCDATVTVAYYARSYLAWVSSHRASSCAGVTCPPLSIPGARLADCGYEAKCANGRCTNTCAPIGGAP